MNSNCIKPGPHWRLLYSRRKRWRKVDGKWKLGTKGLKIQNIADISVSPIFLVKNIDIVSILKNWYRPISTSYASVVWLLFVRQQEIHHYKHKTCFANATKDGCWYTDVNKWYSVKWNVLRFPHQPCCLLWRTWWLASTPVRARRLLVTSQYIVEFCLGLNPATEWVANTLCRNSQQQTVYL